MPGLMRTTLRTIGIAGALLFGVFLFFTFDRPGYVEEIGENFIKREIEKRTGETIAGLRRLSKHAALIRAAEKLDQDTREDIEGVLSQLENEAHERLAEVVAEMRDLDCECRKRYALMFKRGFDLRLASLQGAREKLQDFMKMSYMEVATELNRDLRIFAGSNAIVFLLMLLISFLKPRAIVHLFLPGVLLTVSTLVCSYFYVFEQNWLFTIIYHDYLGFAYLGYVGVVFLFLCDIILNQARITTHVINGILSAIGSAVPVMPC